MKKPVMHATTLMHCNARQVFRDLFSTNQRKWLRYDICGGATKINLKILKTFRHQLYTDGRFEPLTNSDRNIA